MNLGPSVQSSRAVHVFSRIFPLRVRYSALESPALHNARLGAVRRFSTRQFRPRTESGAAVRTSREKGEVRASKSLIDDEAELSDWVSELRTDSFRGQLTSDDEASNADRSRGRTWGSDREKGRESFPVKRRRENDSGEFRGSTRKPIDSFSRNSTVSRFDREDDGLSRRKSHVSRGGKVSSSGEFRESTRNPNDLFSRNSQTARRFDREDDALSRRKNQVSRGGKVSSSREVRESTRNPNDSFSRNSQTVRRFDREDEGLSRKRNHVSRGGNANSLMGSRSGRDVESGSERNRGGNEGLRKGTKDSRKEVRWMHAEDADDNDEVVIDEDEDDDGEKFRGGVGDLLSEEDSHDEDDDNHGELLKKSAGSLFGTDKEVSARVTPGSPGKSDSYLSETRYVDKSTSIVDFYSTELYFWRLTMCLTFLFSSRKCLGCRKSSLYIQIHTTFCEEEKTIKNEVPCCCLVRIACSA